VAVLAAQYCLSSVTTHDLPPTAGYLAGNHLRLRESLGLLTRPAREGLESAAPNWPPGSPSLRRVGLLADDGDDPQSVDAESVVVALHRYVARTPSAAGDGLADRRGR
jgi:4-alpha-glucanotransferase